MELHELTNSARDLGYRQANAEYYDYLFQLQKANLSNQEIFDLLIAFIEGRLGKGLE